MSTVGAQAISRQASVLPSEARLLDAPVLGSRAKAEAGTLCIFMGGAPEDVARHHGPLSTLGTPLHVGPLGAGATAKLVANSALFGVLTALGEAMALADGCGLSRDVAFEVLDATPIAVQAQRRTPSSRPASTRRASPCHWPQGRRADPAAASTSGLRLPVTHAARDWLHSTEAAGWTGHDYSAVVAHILTGREE